MRFSRLQRFSWLLVTLLISHLINPYVEAKEPNLSALQVEVSSFEKLLVIGRGTANTASWKHDGTQLAVGGTLGIWLYNDDFQQVDFIEGHPNGVERVAWSNTGQFIASVVSNASFNSNQIVIWDLAANSVVMVLEGHLNRINALAWNPDGIRLASASTDNSIRIWDTHNGQSQVLEGHTDSVASLSWSPDGSQLASASVDKTVRIWDIASASVLHIQNHTEMVHAVAWSPDGSQIASAGANTEILVWYAADGQILARLKGFRGSIRQLAWSPDSSRLVSSGHQIAIWDMSSVTPLYILEGHLDTSDVVWKPNTDEFISFSGGKFSDDNTVRLWDANTGSSLLTLLEHSSPIGQVTWHPTGTQIITSSADGWLRTWNLQGELENNVPASGVIAAWNTDWTLLATNKAINNGVKIIDWQQLSSHPTGGIIYGFPVPVPSLIDPLDGHPGSVADIAWSSDAHWLASMTGEDNGVHISNTTTWELETILHDSRMYFHNTFSWSPDGSKIAVGGADEALQGSIQLWDVASGSLLTLLEGHRDEVTLLAWSPDSTTLASGSWRDETVRLWNLTEQSSQIVGEYADILIALAWHPDGNILAVASGDKVDLVDIATSTTLATLSGEQAGINTLAWNPSGTLLASGNFDGTIYIWGQPNSCDMPIGSG